MDLKFTQEELDFQSEVRDWLKENYSQDMKERHDNSPNGSISRDEQMQWQKALYKQGWAGINWPKEYGGAEFSASKKYLFNKEMAAVNAPHSHCFWRKDGSTCNNGLWD